MKRFSFQDYLLFLVDLLLEMIIIKMTTTTIPAPPIKIKFKLLIYVPTVVVVIEDNLTRPVTVNDVEILKVSLKLFPEPELPVLVIV